ncbi:hypothetical protein PSTG_10267 [Puccinia striiformis f. sp. tritici PST-78]|uniref:protein-tyrosine-phosphatase n=1 Tax=Puccinia striiformis f. sp. tritici PST-78 TaxID=1165861 RepID=A0A0L0VB41_9BASI|nr:hypothetical protein PSTG_10267 [Puccinia striiformis f. sp. tritici PST-78]
MNTTTKGESGTGTEIERINKNQLIQIISNKESVQDHLILDIRTPSEYSVAQINQSINLNLPTTLLRRPLYGPERIQSSLSTPEERSRFERYKNNQKQLIIIAIDQDGRNINPNHPLTLLLNKFRSIGFTGKLAWLEGGFQSLATTGQHPWLITSTTPEQQQQQNKPTMQSIPLTASLPTPQPQAAAATRPFNHSTKPKRVQMSLSMLPPPFNQASSSSTTTTTTTYPPSTQQQPNKSILNPFFDNIRQLNERLSLSSSLQNLSGIELPELLNPTQDLPRLPPFLRRLLQDSPIERARRLAHEFHDLEMAEQHRLEDVMRWESNRSANSLNRTSSNHHSKTMSEVPLGANRHHHHHPFSISAGVELGYKNRYKNIWPYEHTRIRLRTGQNHRNDTDYMNASMISFRSDGLPKEKIPNSDQVAERRYIATQGPLTSTFEDFWSVVGAEDVGLIIMITRRHEAGREKCADYLVNGQYGDLIVSVDHHVHRGESGGGLTEESDGEEERDMKSGFFGFPQQDSTTDEQADSLCIESQQKSTHPQHSSTSTTTNERSKAGVIRKMIKLSRTSRPDLPARQIAHIQYRGWPDFDVPPAAQDVIELIQLCQSTCTEIHNLNSSAIQDYLHQNSQQNNLTGKDGNQDDDNEVEKIRKLIGFGNGPVVVHCSAGVGRTGSFILLDIMIQVLKALYISPPFPNHQPSSPIIRSPLKQSENNHESSAGKDHKNGLPRFLDSKLCDCRSDVAPIWQTYPIMAVVNEMREQRMSMVANYRQYVFLHEVLLTYMIQELNIPICEPIQSSSMTTTTTATMGMMSMTEEEVGAGGGGGSTPSTSAESNSKNSSSIPTSTTDLSSQSMSQTDLHQKSSSTRSVDRYDNAPPPNHRLFTQSPDIHDPIDNHNVDIDNDHRMSIGTNDHQLPTSSSSIHTDSNHSSSSTTSINHDNFLSPLPPPASMDSFF